MYLTILIPCLNEERTIVYCIKKAKKYLKNLKRKHEILIVDNGSDDKTVVKASKENVRIVIEKQKGYGNAILTGIKKAKGEYIIMGDADCSYDFSNLDQFLEKFREKYDVVCGNRFKGGIEKKAMPFLHQYFGNPVLSFIGRLFFSIKIGDFHCGLRGFNRSKILKLGLETSGMEFASEMLVKSSLNNLKICEVKVKLFRDKRNRKPHLNTWSDGWRHLTFLFFHAPTWLFIIPGLLLCFFGIIISYLTINETFVINTKIHLDIFSLFSGYVMLLIGLQLNIFGIYSKNLEEKKDFKNFLNLHKFIVYSLIFLFLASIYGIYFSINYWIDSDLNLVNYKKLGRYFVSSSFLLLLSFQIFIILLFFNFLKQRMKSRI
jgi:glycosyltransferase involved in cell wall biosynthesis